jgi:HPr kinase/phosphorylase
MYGDAHTRRRKILRFIVRLQTVEYEDDKNTARLRNSMEHIAGDRMSEPEAERLILGVAIPERTLPVAPGRNLAVLVEAAVRDYILRSGGYSATRDLIEKQAQAMQQ